MGLFTFTSVDGGWIPPSEVESHLATLFPGRSSTPVSFESLLRACFPEFSTSLDASTQLDDCRPLVLGLHFNVSSFCAVVMPVRNGGVLVIDETLRRYPHCKLEASSSCKKSPRGSPAALRSGPRSAAAVGLSAFWHKPTASQKPSARRTRYSDG